MVYDVTDKTSFDNVDSVWLKEIDKYCSDNVYVQLLGNKCDEISKRQVTFEEAKEFAEKHNGLDFLEVSAKTSINVEKAFVAMAEQIVKPFQQPLQQEHRPEGKRTPFGPSKPIEDPKWGCCAR